MQKKWSIEEYIKKLSSNSPTPGGGSVAAITSALSSALTSMVFNLTVGKKVYESYDDKTKEEVNHALNISEKYNEVLLDFMDKDQEAFLSLVNSFKLPKDNDKNKKIRQFEIDKGYRNALKIPLELAQKSLEFYEFILIASKYGNKNLISDAGVAAILLYSSIESSILNVNVNASGIKDEKYRKIIEDKCNEILKKALEYKNEITHIVYSKI